MKFTTRLLFCFFISLIICSPFLAQQLVKENLIQQFVSPPNSAKPRVWWHWMNGNITKQGIRKDLEWMHKSGIGGFQNFDASLATPQIVDKRLVYMTPEWKDVFLFTTKLADSLKLEMAIAGSPGWSESGGPWVPASDGMKKIVWSETKVESGDKSTIILSTPPNITGTFQNIALQSEPGLSESKAIIPTFYKDIAVIAYKLPGADIPLNRINPMVSSSNEVFSLSQLTDGDLSITNLLPADTSKGYAWIQFDFPQSQTIKGITMVGGGDKGPFGLYGEFKDTRSLESSDDGVHFKWICFIPAGSLQQQTITIPETKAKYFRVTIKNPPPKFSFASMLGGGEPPKPSPGTEIAELVLHTATRINRFEEKAAFSASTDINSHPTPVTNDVINKDDIVDLTNKLNEDGSLNWTVPLKHLTADQEVWNIVRFGYSLTGKENHPASPEATGLEVDKLNAGAVKKYFETYLDQYKNATGGLMGTKGGLQYIVTDSWEAGTQNWTENLKAEFEKRRGYALLPWMPVLTGHIVHNTLASEQFLWDFRKTLSELVAENHYDQLTTILHSRGMKRYSESHESGRAMIADGMEVKRKSDIPMSAIWTSKDINEFNQTSYQADILESASVAHIYGQNIVAAESLTAFGPGGNAWSFCPENLKPTADLELASGLNRFVIHTSVHQPLDDKIPGVSLGPFGQWFTRHETWAGYAKAWTDYLSRSSYLLQQGKFVADILYYYGEDNNITSLFGNKLPEIPEGYNYDFINADALIHLLNVVKGELVTPSGMKYKVLVLDENAKKMSLPVLRKIRTLVKAGAVVTGIKPVSSPSLSDDAIEFQNILNEVWSGKNKNVFENKSLKEVLTIHGIYEDLIYSKPQVKTRVLFVHRRMPDKDIYWVNNRNGVTEELEINCRLTGKVPELWNAQTGEITLTSYKMENGGTIIPLTMEPHEAFFIVFKSSTQNKSHTIAKQIESQIMELNGPWTVSFQKDRGAPASTVFNSLSSWNENKEDGIKYFSGTATYTHSFSISQIVKGAAYEIDLGEVKNIAEVILNGKSQGITWKTPFKVKLKTGLKNGENTLEIKVTNLWVNRLIGDMQPDVTHKITYTSMPFYSNNAPLLPSGLMGPVKIWSTSSK